MFFVNGIFHSMRSEEDCFYGMEVKKGKIVKVFHSPEELPRGIQSVDLQGKHVYPCLLDGHTHLLLTLAVLAMGQNACEITAQGVEPHDLKGVEKRIRAYCESLPGDAVVAMNNYILSAMDEGRLPTRQELDVWAGGRAIVIYNIDGHSTALSTKMMQMVGLDPEGHNGILQGEENEKTQGRIIEIVGKTVGLRALAKGVGELQNRCAEYGIALLGALEGNADAPKDSTCGLVVRLARHMDLQTRLYLQYTDYERVRPFLHFMKKRRVGGCGSWEMDGAVGAHSAAFPMAYKDTGKTASCYYSREETERLVRLFGDKDFQIASHAIGSSAIERLLIAYKGVKTDRLLRLEHGEFLSEKGFELLREGKYAVEMQPGYAWIDKRYLHTYEGFLPEEALASMRLKSLFDAGIPVCASSDSPVQDLDPYLQMTGMVDFYREEESISPYEAMKAYTVHAAAALEEEDSYGTLEPGKAADFFLADEDFFTLSSEKILSFRPIETYYGGRAYHKKKGSTGELLKLFLKPAHQI